MRRLAKGALHQHHLLRRQPHERVTDLVWAKRMLSHSERHFVQCLALTDIGFDLRITASPYGLDSSVDAPLVIGEKVTSLDLDQLL